MYLHLHQLCPFVLREHSCLRKTIAGLFSCNIQKNSTMTFNCSLLLRHELPESSNKVSRPSNLGNTTFYSYGVRFYALSIMCLRVSEFQLLQLHKSAFEQRTKAIGQVRVNPSGNTPNKPLYFNFFY